MRNSIFIVVIGLFFSCSKEEALKNSLEKYLLDSKHLNRGEVIACAASKKDNADVSFIFYYPIPTATNIQYFETDNSSIPKDDFGSYTKVDLESEPVFNGYLERFIRLDKRESWSVVTYEANGTLYISNPIKLKHQTKPTEWNSQVIIDKTNTAMPKFIWEDGQVKENAIYFQVLRNAANDLLSGTYTYDKFFQFYKLDNVVLNITRETPEGLEPNKEYGFTMMGVSEDNWVNLVIQKSFVLD